MTRGFITNSSGRSSTGGVRSAHLIFIYGCLRSPVMVFITRRIASVGHLSFRVVFALLQHLQLEMKRAVPLLDAGLPQRHASCIVLYSIVESDVQSVTSSQEINRESIIAKVDGHPLPVYPRGSRGGIGTLGSTST